MSELGNAGVASGLQRRYETRGEAPVFGMATELFPMVGAGDSNMDADLGFPAGLRLCGAWLEDAAGGAGVFSAVGLQNPVGSGVMAVITRVYCFAIPPTATRYEFRIDNGFTVAPDSQGPGFCRDSRWGTAQTAVRRVLRTNAAQLGSSVVLVPASVTPAPVVDVPVTPYVLAPGDRVWVSCVDANVAARVGFLWRERAASGGEARG